MNSDRDIVVIVPCYKVKEFVLNVISSVPECVSRIYCVDDACPENSGEFIEENCTDPRVEVIYNESNLGVGGAVQAGYRKAIEDGAIVAVKVDGDGQMDPAMIPRFIEPIASGRADYTKGNRFFWVSDTSQMPRLRIIGNGILSFFSKLSTGYWNIFDPTNGYTAIHVDVLAKMPYMNVSRRFFFESDMLFQLGLIRAAVQDIPMVAKYDDEESNLSVRKVLIPFLFGHMRNTVRRLGYMYFLRDFHLASIEFLFGTIAFLFGVTFSAYNWAQSISTEIPSTAGTVMIGALSIIVGVQMLLGAINYDIQNVPRSAIHNDLASVLSR